VNFEEHHISGVYTIEPQVISDDRGHFFRTYCENEFAALGVNRWVQMNHSHNAKKGTLRGMHYQLPPHEEKKLIRCVSGGIIDVFIDLRADSETFLEWGSVELSAANKRSIFLPEGIAHGFITMEDNSDLIYHHSAFYTSDGEAGIRFDDPSIGINWPIDPSIVSERDLSHTNLTSTFKGIKL
jgi:dTDP-4-dehydrorhamnose 3,5-epimerase